MQKQYKNIKYKVLSIRLSDDIIKELKQRRKQFKSWNLFIKSLLKNK